jgi:hypothetical protein
MCCSVLSRSDSDEHRGKLLGKVMLSASFSAGTLLVFFAFPFDSGSFLFVSTAHKLFLSSFRRTECFFMAEYNLRFTRPYRCGEISFFLLSFSVGRNVSEAKIFRHVIPLTFYYGKRLNTHVAPETLKRTVCGKRRFDLYSPSSRLLPTRMSIPSRLVLASIDMGSDGMNSPSIVGADGKPRMPEYEFHCWTDMVFASTERMQLSTARGDSCGLARIR